MNAALQVGVAIAAPPPIPGFVAPQGGRVQASSDVDRLNRLGVLAQPAAAAVDEDQRRAAHLTSLVGGGLLPNKPPAIKLRTAARVIYSGVLAGRGDKPRDSVPR